MSSLFNSSKGTLAQITAKTNSLNVIADIVRHICPDLPVDAWHIGNISANTLFIEVKSSAWGQRFQFERNNITNALMTQTNGLITKIEIKVRPFHHKKEVEIKPVEKTQFISDKTASQLLEVAKHAPESLKLKLQKLAALARK